LAFKLIIAIRMSLQVCTDEQFVFVYFALRRHTIKIIPLST
jgi:hypothetical protein